jgi:N-acetylglucosaminyldiphosphoundecaprenol N-acetyl-beta-D-mannosaminyltransferase
VTVRPSFYDVLGVPISVTTLAAASKAIQDWAQDDSGRLVFVRDVHGVMQAQDNPELMRLHHDAAMVTPDGMPLVWLGQLAGLPVARTCGPDLMECVLRESRSSGLRHYFYGGKPGVAEALKDAFERRFPGVRIVGTGMPPFRPLTGDEIRQAADAFNASGADVVWIGLSTPKQELLMRDLAPHVRSTLVGVGAAFDFHTGAVRRAPGWMQRAGLEWSWRLASEPRRLWRRYLVMAPAFVWRIVFSRGRYSR